ncbi:TPM domain-containing protein [Microbacterium hominis]|uniref:TPM domain-containing protein n=1 Tax=Microbacterium hominis TaxID=162426 RepID=UPI00196300DE|nr:TPM domain-containing protein [Microbacterium hominis]QRY41629.1 TPM domain-containing protein [Microbacterium hominis]
MRARLWLALTAAAAIVLGGAAAAVATSPVALSSSRVVDQSGVLSGAQVSEVDTRLRALTASSGVDLWVAYVPQFTDPSSPEEWANQTAQNNGLGPHQYLLAISTDGRQYYLSGYSAGPVTGDELTTIEQQRVQPALSSGDWVGAATAAADGLADAIAGGSGGTSAGGAGGIVPILLIVVLLAVAVLVVWIVVRSRRRGPQGATPGAPPVSLEDLARRASSALVQTDDAVKTSEQELGFARAQFGDDAAREFAAALADAKSKLDEAFSLKQRLDDATPDSESDARAWNARIVELCDAANAQLDEKAAAFDELRKLEQNAPEALARLQQLRATVGGAHEAAASALADLRTTYDPLALAPIADNPEQAQQRLAFADTQLTTAQQQIGAGNGGAAAVSIRAAEDAVSQAQVLQDAVGRLGADLAQAETDAAALIADLETDIAAASALPDPDGRIAPVVAATRAQVDAARALITGTAKRPLFARDELDRANAQIDALLAGVRDAQQQAARAAQQLGGLLAQAQGEISAAEDFIGSRRGAVGAEARTRLAEAGASLVQARQLQQSDPAQALAAAQRAHDLATQALRAAQNDVGVFQGGMFGGTAPAARGNGSGDMMGAILGGIVINSLLGGGGRGGSSGSRGGSISPGGFGGAGSRSRRGGGRF